MKERIKERAFSSPILSAISVSLFAVVIFSIPGIFKLQKNGLFYLHIVCRTVAAAGALILAKICGFKVFSKPKFTSSAILLTLLGLLVCVNNFPIIGFSTGNVKLLNDPETVKYLCYCAAIGIAEELIFRGFILSLVGVGLKGKKYAPLLTVAVSAAIFSFCHLFNIFSAGLLPTLLQVGYTFLTGCLFGTVYLFTENVIFPILLHIVYDVGGLIFTDPFGIAVGNMWDTYTVIITVVLGVATAIIFSIALCRFRLSCHNE